MTTSIQRHEAGLARLLGAWKERLMKLSLEELIELRGNLSAPGVFSLPSTLTTEAATQLDRRILSVIDHMESDGIDVSTYIDQLEQQHQSTKD